MFVFTFGSGMRDRCLYSDMEEECQIDVFIHIRKRNAIQMFVFTYGRGMPDRCFYSYMEESYRIDVCNHNWKGNAR